MSTLGPLSSSLTTALPSPKRLRHAPSGTVGSMVGNGRGSGAGGEGDWLPSPFGRGAGAEGLAFSVGCLRFQCRQVRIDGLA